MTLTTSAKVSSREESGDHTDRPFAGYGTLLRLALRRDRIKLPAWVLGVSVFTAYFANALQIAYPEKEDLLAIMGFMDSPAGAVMSGPGYGFDDPDHAIVFAGGYGLYLLVAAAFLNVLLVGRHTRAEEEDGRLELVRAAAVGRLAPLTVAATLAVMANLAVFLLAWGSVGAAHGYAGGALFAAGLAMVGLVFAGVALVTAQLAEHSRSATGLASLVVGTAVVVRGAGDTIAVHGSWLSWFSPIAWAQQTRVFFDDRWWPLTLGVVLAVGFYVMALALQGRRDVGAGILSTRPGSPGAAAWLGTPWGLAFRLERGAILGWSIALLAMGALYGGLTASVESSLADVDNEVLIQAMGGDPSRMIDGYLATDGLFDAFIASCFVIVAAHRLTKEEREGRAEVALAARVSRPVWLLATFLVALAGGVLLLLSAGLGLGLTSALTTGEAAYLGSTLGAHLAYAPALAVFAGVAVLGYAFRPAWLNLAWVVAVYAMIVGYLGFALDLPGWLANLSVFEHVAMAPLEEQEVGPLVGLTLLAVALVVAALVYFRGRDVTTG